MFLFHRESRRPIEGKQGAKGRLELVFLGAFGRPAVSLKKEL